MTKQMPYTIIYLVAVGYSRTLLPQMRRIRTANLNAYIERHALDVTHVFEGHPKQAKS